MYLLFYFKSDLMKIKLDFQRLAKQNSMSDTWKS